MTVYLHNETPDSSDKESSSKLTQNILDRTFQGSQLSHLHLIHHQLPPRTH